MRSIVAINCPRTASIHSLAARRAARSANEATETAGGLLHERILAEARLAISFLLPGPPTAPEEAAYVLDVVSGGELNEITLSVLADVLAG